MIYSLNNDSWVETFEIADEIDTYNGTGNAVSLSNDGNTVAISSNLYNNKTGQTRVYRTDTENIWSQIGTDINGENEGDEFGSSVSLSQDGNTIAIGASKYSAADGTAYLYTYGGGAWSQSVQLNGTTGEGNEFGSSVYLTPDASKLAISSPAYDNNNGLARVYENSNTTWSQVGANILSGQSAGTAFFGYSLSLSNDATIVAIGAYGYNGSGGWTSDGFVKTFNYSDTALNVDVVSANDILFTVNNGTIYATSKNIKINVFDFSGKQIANKNLEGLYIVQFINTQNDKVQTKKLGIR